MAETERQIERFLKRNRQGPLLVAVGYASAFGLRWLNERTARRDVSLLIGDVETGFSNFTEDDRKSAVEFLRRPDVQVRQRRDLHAKAWLVQRDPDAAVADAVLVGSANLSKQGLLHNVEMLSVVPESEHDRLYAQMDAAFRSSWDITDSLLVRLGEQPTSPWVGPSSPSGARPRRQRKLPAGCLRPLLAMLVLALVLAFLVFLVPRVIDSLIDGLDPPETPSPDTSGAVASNPPSTAPEPTAPATSSPEATAAEESSGQSSQDPTPSETSLPDAPQPDAPVPEPSASAGCPYLTVVGEDACPLLESLHGVDLTPCDALPIGFRPLRLVGDANPAGYQAASYSPDLVCTWMEAGTYIAGETIPAGDLRSVNSTIHGTGSCHFVVHDDEGEVIMSRDTYANRWITHSLIRLQPGDEIATSGCGWVPARAASLDLDPGTALSPETAAKNYPLLIGTDIEGRIRIECPFRTWAVTEPSNGRSWNAALAETPSVSHQPGPYHAQAGLIQLDC